MAPVILLEPNGCQALLSHDDAIEDLKSQGWDVFLKKFEGYNLQVAKDFARKPSMVAELKLGTHS
jgi:hypothetical protein